MSRRPAAADQPNLTVVQGDATNPDDIRRAITGSDALIVAIGTGKNMGATTIYSESARALAEVFNETQSPVPVLVVTGFGTADTPQYQSLFVRLFMKIMLGAAYRDKTRMEQTIAASTIRWEIVRPGQLTDTPATGHYQAITDYHKGMKIDRISRADVAHFLISQAESPTLLGKYPALTY